MKTIFDQTTRTQLIARVNLLNADSTAQWGKMNIFQMIKHCSVYEKMMHGKNKYKRTFLGLLFGRMALKEFVGDESPIKKNVPTLSELKVKEKNGDVEVQKRIWIALLEQYEDFPVDGIIHSFFGALTREQIGYLVYKHTDHHLRQFNC